MIIEEIKFKLKDGTLLSEYTMIKELNQHLLLKERGEIIGDWTFKNTPFK